MRAGCICEPVLYSLLLHGRLPKQRTTASAIEEQNRLHVGWPAQAALDWAVRLQHCWRASRGSRSRSRVQRLRRRTCALVRAPANVLVIARRVNMPAQGAGGLHRHRSDRQHG